MTTPTQNEAAELTDERKKFEAWVKIHFACPDLEHWGKNGYKSNLYGYAWEAWQARSILSAQANDAKGKEDAKRLDWLESDMKRDEPVGIYYYNGAFRFPYLVNNDGGFGGGVGEFYTESLRSTIDAAIQGMQTGSVE